MGFLKNYNTKQWKKSQHLEDVHKIKLTNIVQTPVKAFVVVLLQPLIFNDQVRPVAGVEGQPDTHHKPTIKRNAPHHKKRFRTPSNWEAWEGTQVPIRAE